MECRLACVEPVAAENPESPSPGPGEAGAEREAVRWSREAADVSREGPSKYDYHFEWSQTPKKVKD